MIVVFGALDVHAVSISDLGVSTVDVQRLHFFVAADFVC